MEPVNVDGLLVARAEWDVMTVREQRWVIATRALALGLPASFMSSSGDRQLELWAARVLGIKLGSMPAYRFMIKLSLTMSWIEDGLVPAWTSGARWPVLEDVEPSRRVMGMVEMGRIVLGAARETIEGATV